MPQNWNDEAVKKYLSLNPPQLSEDDFRLVHYPIDRILVEYLQNPVVDERFVTQKQFQETIITADLKEQNRIIIVEGEVGSGKSHLCTWLRHELGDTPADGQDDRVAVQVTRGTRSFNDVLLDLSKLVGVESQPSTIDEFDPQLLAKSVVEKLEAFSSTQLDSFSQKEMAALTESREKKLDLTDIVESNIRTYQSGRSSNASPALELIDRDKYRQLQTIVFDEPPNEQGFKVLRNELNNALFENLGVSDLSDRLSSISDAATDKGFRPVLICSDISELGVFRDALLEYGIQLNSGCFDIVVGWSSGWIHDKTSNEQNDFYAYICDKSEGYFRLSDSKGQTYFLTKDTAVNLVERYIRAVHSESNKTFTDTVRLKPFGGLYPFNAAFISRLYTHLQQQEAQKRTPRLLLRAIRECLLASAPPFITVEQLPYVGSVQEPVPMDCPSETVRLIKWYGTIGEKGVTISRGIFETFDLEITTEIKQNDKIELTE